MGAAARVGERSRHIVSSRAWAPSSGPTAAGSIGSGPVLEIAQIQTATKEAVASIHGISGTITEISDIAAAIAAAVEEQGSATQEIARNVQQAAAGTSRVTSNIAGVSDGANNTGAAATEVLGAAGDLSRQAEQLNAEVGRFIAGVKAA